MFVEITVSGHYNLHVLLGYMVLSLICTSSEINQEIYSQYKIILLF